MKILLQSISFLIPVIGWWVGYAISKRIDQKRKRIDIRTNYLIETYQELNKLRSNTNAYSGEEFAESVTKILSDTELFGSPLQIQLVRGMAEEIENNSTFNQVHRLIDSLRDDLRKELWLSKSEGQVTYLATKKTEHGA